MFAGIFSCTPSFSPEINKVYIILSYLSEYVCNIWLRSDGRIERKRGYRHTDSWHEWVQDNFYGGSATKRIVIKEPSLDRRSSQITHFSVV